MNMTKDYSLLVCWEKLRRIRKNLEKKVLNLIFTLWRLDLEEIWSFRYSTFYPFLVSLIFGKGKYSESMFWLKEESFGRALINSKSSAKITVKFNKSEKNIIFFKKCEKLLWYVINYHPSPFSYVILLDMRNQLVLFNKENVLAVGSNARGTSGGVASKYG